MGKSNCVILGAGRDDVAETEVRFVLQEDGFENNFKKTGGGCHETLKRQLKTAGLHFSELSKHTTARDTDTERMGSRAGTTCQGAPGA